MAHLLALHQAAGPRLAEVPGLGVDSAQQIIAEVGADATTVASPQQLASWVGACPGKEESAGVSSSQHSPKGNRQMRRRLNQAANAAVKTKGRLFQLVYRRLVPRLGHAQAIGAIAHRLCRLIWKILHDGVRYVERGPAVSRARTERRAAKMIPRTTQPRLSGRPAILSTGDASINGDVFRSWFEELTTPLARPSGRLRSAALTRDLHGFDEVLDRLLNPVRHFDELDSALVDNVFMFHVADLAVGDAPLDDDRSAAERQADFMEGVELKRERRLDSRTGRAELFDRHGLEDHHLAAQFT